MSALAEKIRALDAKIDEKETETKRAWKSFDDFRTELADSDADLSDENGEAFTKAHESHRVYGELADEVDGLKRQRERLWMMSSERSVDHVNGDSPAARELRELAKDGAHSRYSPGARLIASETYRVALESGLLTGPGDNLGQRVALGSMYETAEEFVDYINHEASVVVTKDGGADTVRPFIQPEIRGLVEPRFRPLFMRDLVTVGTIGTDSVEWVLETGYVPGAAAVPEATTDAPIGGGVTAAQGGVKPQTRLSYQKRTSNVSAIAHWVAATKRSLADVGRLRTIVDARLRRGLEDLIENQIIAGDPSVNPDNLQGILQTPGIQWQNSGSGSFLEHILRGMTKVQLAFFQVQATALNPLDWQDIRLLRDLSGGANSGQYLFGPPSQAGASTLWGYPTVTGPQMPQGTALTGDFRTAEFLVREGVTVVASDSHADFFVRNLVAVLAETRAAFIIPQPESMCEIGPVQPS